MATKLVKNVYLLAFSIQYPTIKASICKCILWEQSSHIGDIGHSHCQQFLHKQCRLLRGNLLSWKYLSPLKEDSTGRNICTGYFMISIKQLLTKTFSYIFSNISKHFGYVRPGTLICINSKSVYSIQVGTGSLKWEVVIKGVCV